MKSLTRSLLSLKLTVLLAAALPLLNAHGEKAEKAAADAPAAEAAKPEPGSADEIFAAPAPLDLNGFGSEAPVQRTDLPERGVIKLGPKDFIHNSMQHWEQYDWTTFKTSRWGRYNVRLTYTLGRASLPVQFRLGEQRLKKNLTGTKTAAQAYLGTVYLEKTDAAPFSLFAPSTGAEPALHIQEIAFIPARESDEEIAPAEDGSLLLPAKAAITWSETMRYEPKPEKDCLGFWTEPADFAEWEFVLTKPGRYRVIVTQGCGSENGGSKVELRLNGQKTSFTVADTGGFQNWKEVDAGILDIQKTGMQRLVVQPLEKKGKAVLDIKSVQLVPAS